ncbi:Sodium/hydrogen exchanger family [Rhizoctonia solani]|uniref:Sodium/hydrogen exchanger family n=1 Tax=Rhizoctonia solani TaxID=456999 RepID=A0A8H7M555_9AGAM|nr:Sodium/hydrogen exchanger family [Rhizoctonia solani]
MVVLIVCMTQGLALLFAKINQPRVIAEVVGGILLGPTAFGRIPNFSATVFPPQSLPYLSLVANIGLCLFMFVTGMEVDLAVFRRNAKKSIVISAAGMLLPFAVGVGVAVPVYHKFVNPGDASFGLFLLFIGVAISITAFPVLCRILTELNLLDTHVGITTLSAAVVDDVTAWILLALTVTLINASDGLTALWILLTCVGWILFIVFPIKWGYLWLARRSGSLGNGTPTPSMMTVTMLLVFVSSFFTDVIGVHAIFGAFIAGLIVPRDNGFSISLLEKIEDLVSILFLPLYFTLSGLKTDLGLLNDGTAWGIPSCLVELIVLNIGLSAGILDTKVFSMFVMMAVILTFITSPCTILIYPEHAREHVSPNKSSSETPVNRTRRRSTSNTTGPISLMTRFTVVLSKVEHLPAVMTLTQFLQPPQTTSSTMSKAHLIGYSDEKVDVLDPNSQAISPLAGNLPVLSDGTPRVSIDALRLIELTERTSAVMKGTGSEELMHRDTVISVMRTFGHLNRIPVSSVLSIVPRDSFSSSVTSHARETNADLVSFRRIHSMLSLVADQREQTRLTMNYSQFIRRVFAESPSDVALFIDRGLSPLETNTTYGQHIFLPFSGGPDDRLALAFDEKTDGLEEVETRFTDLKAQQSTTELDNNITVHSVARPDTVYPQNTTQHRLQSEAADNLLWTQMTSSSAVQSPVVQNTRSRVTFVEDESPVPLAGILQRCKFEHTTATSNNKALLVVVGRGRRMAELYTDELRGLVASSNASATIGSEVRRTVEMWRLRLLRRVPARVCLSCRRGECEGRLID